MRGITDTVKHLLIINIIVFAGTYFTLGDPTVSMRSLIEANDPSRFWEWNRYILALFMPGSSYFEPVQLVTHMFMHGDITHLFFNMFGIYIFGPLLESLWGPKRFLIFYFIAGLGALTLHLLINYWQVSSGAAGPWLFNVPMLGASGALFGLIIGAGMKFPNVQLMLLIPPMPVKMKYIAIFYAVFELYMGLGNFSTGIAHFAHIGGGIAGFLVILFWNKTGS